MRANLTEISSRNIEENRFMLVIISILIFQAVLFLYCRLVLSIVQLYNWITIFSCGTDKTKWHLAYRQYRNSITWIILVMTSMSHTVVRVLRKSATDALDYYFLLNLFLWLPRSSIDPLGMSLHENGGRSHKILTDFGVQLSISVTMVVLHNFLKKSIAKAKKIDLY